ncbi:MAG: hypothetical protein K0R66_1334 [Gammaproteobacteria bacterium]|nr:hypothetical protein [Gammaproteobacteria bacterium]
MSNTDIQAKKKVRTIDNNQLCTALHTLGILIPVGFFGAAATHYIEPRSALFSTAIPGLVFPYLSYTPAIAGYRAGDASAMLTAGRCAAAGALNLGSALILSDIDNQGPTADVGMWLYAAGSAAIWLLGLDKEEGRLQNLFTIVNAINDFVSIGVLGSSLNNHISLPLALALTAGPNALCALLSFGMILFSLFKNEKNGLSNSMRAVQLQLSLFTLIGAALMFSDLGDEKGRAEVGVWSIAVCTGALRTLPMPGKRQDMPSNEDRASLLDTEAHPGHVPTNS